MGKVSIDEATLLTSVLEFKGPYKKMHGEAERMLQPVIHSTLLCAAQSAQDHTGRQFFVTTEPVVFQDSTKLFANEVVYEGMNTDGMGIGVSTDDVMKILVEVKGRKSFPRSFEHFDKFDQSFSQLIQEAALALVSGKWHSELLIAVATIDWWYMFRIVDESDDKCTKFDVYDNWMHFVRAPYYLPEKVSLSNVQDVEDHHELITFLTSYLCTPSVL